MSLSPFLNAKDFGAVGDGIADDRVAIQAAMDAATAAALPLFIPAGTYRGTRSGSNAWVWKPTGPLELQGVAGKTVLGPKSGLTASACNTIYLQDVSDVLLRDLVIDGNWGNSNGANGTGGSITTSISASSNGADVSTFTGAATLNVASTSPLATTDGGVLYARTSTGWARITFTGTSGGTSFTQCTTVSGSGLLSSGGAVFVGVNAPYGINHATYAGANTTVAASSDNVDISTFTGSGILNVADNTGAPASGGLYLLTTTGWQHLAYTGKSGTTQFTGVTSGGAAGVINTGNPAFTPVDPRDTGIAIYLRTQRIVIDNCKITQCNGDGVYIAGDKTSSFTQDITLRNCVVDMTARHGITVSSHVKGLTIKDTTTKNVFGSALRVEPENTGNYTGVDGIVVDNCNLSIWWADIGVIKQAVTIVGTGRQEDHLTYRVRLQNNKIYGSVSMAGVKDVQIARNQIRQVRPFGDPAVLLSDFVDDCIVDSNDIYDCSNSTYGLGAISHLQNIGFRVQNLRISGNVIRSRNGRDGIYLMALGGFPGETNTATAVTDTSLTRTGAGWTANSFIGCRVLLGGAIQTVNSNTTDTLTFQPSSSWTDAFGNVVAAPAPGTYVIQASGGVVEVFDNTIDGINDGNGAGGYGVRLDAQQPGARILIRRNSIRGATTSGIYIVSPMWTANAYKLVDVSDNVVWDDQPTPTCTNALQFSGSSNLGKLVLRGNTNEGAVTVDTTGLTSVTWLVEQGPNQRWAGFGSPESVVTAPVSSLYQRVDGGASTALYVKETGTGSTGWQAK